MKNLEFCSVLTVIGLICFISSIGATTHECGENEEYTCKDPRCISTCQKMNFRPCNDTALCLNACHCKSGFIRDMKSKKCVELSDCPNCSDGRVYGWGNKCANRCNSHVCPAIAILGCYCPSGQCELDGICVPREDVTGKTTHQCGENEEYTCKDPRCISTCQKMNFRACNDTAFCLNACHCKSGFIRDMKSKKCGKLSDCPNCSDGKVYGWGNKCANKCGSTICTMIAQLGCFCPSGQCELDGVCVPKSTIIDSTTAD